MEVRPPVGRAGTDASLERPAAKVYPATTGFAPDGRARLGAKSVRRKPLLLVFYIISLMSGLSFHKMVIIARRKCRICAICVRHAGACPGDLR